MQVTIAYFFLEDRMDVDNIPKPVLDALKGLVFIDDRQVTDLCCRKRDLAADPPSAELTFEHLGYLEHEQPMVHVSIAPSLDAEHLP